MGSLPKGPLPKGPLPKGSLPKLPEFREGDMFYLLLSEYYMSTGKDVPGTMRFDSRTGMLEIIHDAVMRIVNQIPHITVYDINDKACSTLYKIINYYYKDDESFAASRNDAGRLADYARVSIQRVIQEMFKLQYNIKNDRPLTFRLVNK